MRKILIECVSTIYQEEKDNYDSMAEAFDQMNSGSDGIIGDFGEIPEGQILTEDDLKRLNIDPSQFEVLR